MSSIFNIVRHEISTKITSPPILIILRHDPNICIILNCFLDFKNLFFLLRWAPGSPRAISIYPMTIWFIPGAQLRKPKKQNNMFLPYRVFFCVGKKLHLFFTNTNYLIRKTSLIITDMHRFEVLRF